MAERFKNRYRIPSARLQNWDYGWNGAYFVTICTAHRECYFGELVETPKLGVSTAKIQLSEIGKIAEHYWHEIPHHFPFVELGEFIVMPNHVHGIIIINKSNDDETPDADTPKLGVSASDIFTEPDIVETPESGVSTAPSPKWNPGTLGVIINQYKRICTLNARKIHAGFEWQTRFHDHIIRNDLSFQRISEYIQNNPLKWGTDQFHNKPFFYPERT